MAKSKGEDNVQKNDTLQAQDAADINKTLETDTPLDKVVFYAFDEAREKLESSGEVEPFTVIVHGDDLYIETHPGNSIYECFNSAQQTIKTMDMLADAYVFCYDGYVQLEEGSRDALIVERAYKNDEAGEAFALLYTFNEEEKGSFEFDDGIYDLGDVSSLFAEEEFNEEQLEELGFHVEQELVEQELVEQELADDRDDEDQDQNSFKAS